MILSSTKQSIPLRRNLTKFPSTNGGEMPLPPLNQPYLMTSIASDEQPKIAFSQNGKLYSTLPRYKLERTSFATG